MIPVKGDIVFLNRALIKEFEDFGISSSNEFKNYIDNPIEVITVIKTDKDDYFIEWKNGSANYNLCIKKDGIVDYKKYGGNHDGKVQAFVKENKELDPKKHCTCDGKGKPTPMFTSIIIVCKSCGKEKLNC